MSRPAVAWWFDPLTGTASRIEGCFATTGATALTPPTSGVECDWLLDSETSLFRAPGVVQ
ncbi:MAG: hypothetical protein HY508_12050 [Acidobacteria bacterium]|nr:hypothetical protein [Acidobacteriota bacterium]